MNIFQSIIIGIICGLVSALIFEILKDIILPWLKKWYYYQKLWGHFINEPYIIIYGSQSKNGTPVQNGGKCSYLGEGDLWPIIISLATVWKYGVKPNDRTLPKISNQSNDINNKHIILIGGEASNTLTKTALQNTGIRYKKITQDKWNILAGDKTFQRRGAIENKLFDLGICIFRRSPWDNEKYLLHISGTSSYGAEGVAKFLSNKRNLSEVNKYIKKNKTIRLGIIVKSFFRNNCYVQGKIVFSLHKLSKWEKLKDKIITVLTTHCT